MDTEISTPTPALIPERPPWFSAGRKPRDPAREAERRKIRCPKCPSFWTGLKACHCAACHRTFSAISSFDMHRGGDHAKGTRHCLDPVTMVDDKTGEALLVLVAKPGDWMCWSQPGTYDGPYEEDANGQA